MTKQPSIDPTYSISPEESALLLGALHLPERERTETLVRFLDGPNASRLLSQFMGLAAGVYQNAREFMEIEIVVQTGEYPHSVEKWNFPTLTGALLGIRTSHGVKQDGLCEGCAFRLGTHANQCESTNIDARGQCAPGEPPFLCHMTEDGKEPHSPCVGWARARVPLARSE
jgi:hypothetical protein